MSYSGSFVVSEEPSCAVVPTVTKIGPLQSPTMHQCHRRSQAGLFSRNMKPPLSRNHMRACHTILNCCNIKNFHPLSVDQSPQICNIFVPATAARQLRWRFTTDVCTRLGHKFTVAHYTSFFLHIVCCRLTPIEVPCRTQRDTMGGTAVPGSIAYGV